MIFEPTILVGVFAAGFVLGLFYFGGLWWTVNQLTTARYVGALFAVSFLLRTAVTLYGFYWIIDLRWERALIAVVGFVLARLFTVRHWGLVN